MRRSTAGCRAEARSDSSGLVRSAASVYWMRSLVPIEKKSAWRASTSAMSAAAGTSTMIPSWTVAAHGRPSARSAAARASRRARTAVTSSAVETMGSMTRSSPSGTAPSSAVSWSSSRAGWRSPRRTPRTPRAGLASGGTSRQAAGLSPPTSSVLNTTGRPSMAARDRPVGGRLLGDARRCRPTEEQQLGPHQADAVGAGPGRRLGLADRGHVGHDRRPRSGRATPSGADAPARRRPGPAPRRRPATDR